jgi:hypothetical protein
VHAKNCVLESKKNIQSHFGPTCFARVLPQTHFGKEIRWNRVHFVPYPQVVARVFAEKVA